MKDKDEFLKKMENLEVPDINPAGHQKTVKMAIMNAERSAVLGVWLIAVPCYFLFCVFMYYYFHVRINWFEAMFNLMSSLDKNPYLKILSPLLLVLLPIVGIVINALSIIHVQYQKLGPDKGKLKEFSITVKIKIWNILLILLSLAVVCVFIGYVIIENITIKN
ncbi:MAG: hypothetical protein JWQ63_496 [Mucilaginibacter sp.]|nr:hypothetical protein [Mucilaginibacter sp.]